MSGATVVVLYRCKDCGAIALARAEMPSDCLGVEELEVSPLPSAETRATILNGIRASIETHRSRLFALESSTYPTAKMDAESARQDVERLVRVLEELTAKGWGE
jgi:hypothetical protein